MGRPDAGPEEKPERGAESIGNGKNLSTGMF